MVVAAEPQGVGGAGRRERAVAVRRELVTEQLTGWIIVLADHHRRQLFDLGKHAEMSAEPVNLSPSEVHRLDRVRRERSGGAIDVVRHVAPHQIGELADEQIVAAVELLLDRLDLIRREDGTPRPAALRAAEAEEPQIRPRGVEAGGLDESRTALLAGELLERD